MKISIIVALFVVLVAYDDCRAQVVRIKLENCKLDKKTLDHIQNSLVYQLRFYAKVFNQPSDTSFRARVFGTEKEYIRWSKANADFNPGNHALAFFSRRLNEMILHVQIDDFAKTFSHEVSHAILQHYCQRPSTWLTEGLAEFFEDIVANETEYYVEATQQPKVNEVKMLFLEGRSIKEAISTRTFYEQSALHRNYRLSFATILYLYHTKKEVLAKVISGDCEHMYDAFELYYPDGLDQLQIDVKSWFLNYQPTLD